MLSDLLRVHHGTRVVKGRHGAIAYWANDVVIGGSIAAYGEWFESEVDVFKLYLNAGDTAIDVGANIGAHSIALAEIVGPRGRVISIEPQRPMMMCLCANAALNGYLQIEPHQAAAGACSGELRCARPDYSRLSSFGGFSPADAAVVASDARAVSDIVPVIAIDDLDRAKPKLIKIDVEGAEAEVIRGARSTIEIDRPVLYVENDRVDRSEALVRLLRSLRYRLHWHIARFFNPENFARNPVEIHRVGIGHANGQLWVNGLSLNMLCVPEERDLPVPADVILVGDDDEHPCRERDRERLLPHLKFLD